MTDQGPRLEALLAERMAPIIARARRARLMAGWAGLGGAVALLGISLRWLEEHRGWHIGWGWLVLLAATGGAGFLVWRRGQRSAADVRAVARLIEARQPDLHALLLTAVAQTPSEPGGTLGYLQTQLVQQALDRADPQAWAQVVPARRLAATTAAAAAAGLVLGYCALTALVPGMSSLFDDAHGLSVTPGHTQAERGTTVLVLARFAGRLPARVELVVRVPGQGDVRTSMRRSMEDPVWGALTPALAGSVEYFVEHDGGRSPGYRITVFRAPDVERLDARIEYPGQPAREVRDARFLSVTEGARVTLSAHLVKGAQSVRSVTLVADGEPGESLRLSPSQGDGNVFVGVLTPARTRRYEVRVTDRQGRGNQTPPRLSIEVHRNQPAQITLTFPGKDTTVSPLEEVTVEARISDDTAVLGYGVAYHLAGQPLRERRLDAPAGAGGKPQLTVTARAVIALEELGAQPDQLLTYHFWAEDRDAGGKLRRTSSDMYFAEVRPFEQRFREIAGGGEGEEGGEGGALADQARRQKDIINATWRLDRQVRDLHEGGDAGEAAAALSRDIEVVAKAQDDLRAGSEALQAKARDGRTRAALAGAVTAMTTAHRELQQAGKPAGKNLAAAGAPLTRAREAEQRAYAALLRLREAEQNVARGRGQEGQGQGQESPELSGLELKQQESRFETRRQARAQRPARPDREALGRLEELARRQKALSERLKEAAAALEPRAAEAEAERRLKRLREEQQELLEEIDQLRQRLERQAAESAAGPGERQGERQAALERTRAELERTRAEAAAAAEALARGQAARALGASTRAERGLDRARGDLAKDLAAGFEDELRELRDAARALDERQSAIAEALGAGQKAGGPGTAGGPARAAGGAGAHLPSEPANPTEERRLGAELRRQKAEASKLLERIEAVSGEAEQAAPLLSRKLYDGLREAKMSDLEPALDLAGELLERNLGEDGRAAERRARGAVGELRGRVDEAAKGVLGDEAEALRAAQSELDGLIAEAKREATPAGPAPAPAGNAEPGSARKPANAGGPPGPGGAEGPITGGNFRGFAERLRDLQDLLEDGRLRNQAAGVGDRARALRADWKNQGQRPSAALLEEQVLRPLAELRSKVGEQLGRLERNDKLVPLDRDPIPSRYTDLVRRYWKSLSQGK